MLRQSPHHQDADYVWAPWDEVREMEAGKRLGLWARDSSATQRQSLAGAQGLFSATRRAHAPAAATGQTCAGHNKCRVHPSRRHTDSAVLRQRSPDASHGTEARGGRGQGHYAPRTLEGGLPTSTSGQGWSVTTVNHPLMAAIQRHRIGMNDGGFRRHIDRAPVGYRLAPHSSGGVVFQPVGYRIRVSSGAGSLRDAPLLDGGLCATGRVATVPDAFSDVDDHRLRSVCATGGHLRASQSETEAGSGSLLQLSSTNGVCDAFCSAVGASRRPLLSPLLMEVDLRLRRQRLGTLSDMWAASPAAMDEVLSLAGLTATQRKTIVWEMQRMIRSSI